MHFNLEITKNCNQKCFYCFNDSGSSHQKDELSLAEWKNILSEIYALGHKSVLITGGEPFLHPDIIEILEHAIGLGLETSILSNGYKIAMLTEKHATLFSKLTLAQISLDSMNSEVHNMRRGYSHAFEDAISAINALKKVNVPVEISVTVSDENIQDIHEIASFCGTINSSLIIRPLIYKGKAKLINKSDNIIYQISIAKNILSDYQRSNIVEDRFSYVSNNTENKDCVTINQLGEINGTVLFAKFTSKANAA